MAQNGKVQHIWCSASIFKKMEDVFIAFICNQATSGVAVEEYVVYLTTTGGSPFSGINLYNFMKALPQKKTVYNMGSIDSAGVQFFLGFDHRFGVPDCSFMIHQTLLPRSALPELFNVFDLQTEGEKLSATDYKTHNIIEKETKDRAKEPLTLEAIQAAALQTKTYHSDEAMAKGFIDEIVQPKLPKDNVFYLTDQYLATLLG